MAPRPPEQSSVAAAAPVDAMHAIINTRRGQTHCSKKREKKKSYLGCVKRERACFGDTCRSGRRSETDAERMLTHPFLQIHRVGCVDYQCRSGWCREKIVCEFERIGCLRVTVVSCAIHVLRRVDISDINGHAHTSLNQTARSLKSSVRRGQPQAHSQSLNATMAPRVAGSFVPPFACSLKRFAAKQGLFVLCHKRLEFGFPFVAFAAVVAAAALCLFTSAAGLSASRRRCRRCRGSGR